MNAQNSAFSRTKITRILIAFLVVWVLTGCNLPKGPGLLPTARVEFATTEAAPVNEEETPRSAAVMDTGAPLPPQVVERSPQKGQELRLDGVIELVFDQDMDQAGTEAAWQVMDVSGKEIPGKITWLSPRTFQFTPDQAFSAGQRYKASLSTRAASAQGISIPDPLSFEYAAATGLQVSQVFPSDKTKDVENTAVITVTLTARWCPLSRLSSKTVYPIPSAFLQVFQGKGNGSILRSLPTALMWF